MINMIGCLEQKRLLRTDMKQLRDKQMVQTQSKELIAEKNTQITENLLTLDAFRRADLILCYMSYRNEADTVRLIRYLLTKDQVTGQNRKRVAVPKTFGEGIMEFYEIQDMESLLPGYASIPEPNPAIHRKIDLSAENSIFMAVPALAVDEQFQRLGYGGGYYDRYLGRLDREKRENSACGALVFEEQVLYSIPAEHTDCRMDYIITDRRVMSRR